MAWGYTPDGRYVMVIFVELDEVTIFLFGVRSTGTHLGAP